MLKPDDFTWYGGNIEWRSYDCTECDGPKIHHPVYDKEMEYCPYCGEPA